MTYQLIHSIGEDSIDDTKTTKMQTYLFKENKICLYKFKLSDYFSLTFITKLNMSN